MINGSAKSKVRGIRLRMLFSAALVVSYLLLSSVSAYGWKIKFVVFDEPLQPMSPAWVSVLRISCEWARLISTKDAALNKLTVELFNRGEYNGGNPAFTRNETTSGELFFLKAFIDNGLTGQCNDFTDFLVCLVASVGSHPIRARRTEPWNAAPRFRTNLIDPAGTIEPLVEDWNYHQFTILGTSVWDACLSFYPPTHPAGIPKGLTRDTIYYGGNLNRGLVRFFYVTGWEPAPENGFIPTITAEALPQDD
jgi:hypothetical protein